MWKLAVGAAAAYVLYLRGGAANEPDEAEEPLPGAVTPPASEPQSRATASLNAKQLNDMLYVFVTGPNSPAERSRGDDTTAKEQRQDFIYCIRTRLGRSGDCLVSKRDEDSFSYHGSLYKRDHPRELKDIDMYVVLNGQGLIYPRDFPGGKGGNVSLEGRSGAVHVPFHDPASCDAVSAIDAVVWMQRIVQSTVDGPGYSHEGGVSIEHTGRGAKVSGLGSPPRRYDIIPAFLIMEDNQRQHIVPKGDGDTWELVKTDAEKAAVKAWDHAYPADPLTKRLGFRQTVNLMKVISEKKGDWSCMYGLSSTVLERTVRDVFEEVPCSDLQPTNQEVVRLTTAKLNDVIQAQVYQDPETGERVDIRNSIPPGTRPIRVTEHFLQNEVCQ